jgi:hypothetical protein
MTVEAATATLATTVDHLRRRRRIELRENIT